MGHGGGRPPLAGEVARAGAGAAAGAAVVQQASFLLTLIYSALIIIRR